MITQRKLDEVRLRAEMKAVALFQRWQTNFLAGRMPEPELEGMVDYGNESGQMGSVSPGGALQVAGQQLVGNGNAAQIGSG